MSGVTAPKFTAPNEPATGLGRMDWTRIVDSSNRMDLGTTSRPCPLLHIGNVYWEAINNNTARDQIQK